MNQFVRLVFVCIIWTTLLLTHPSEAGLLSSLKTLLGRSISREKQTLWPPSKHKKQSVESGQPPEAVPSSTGKQSSDHVQEHADQSSYTDDHSEAVKNSIVWNTEDESLYGGEYEEEGEYYYSGDASEDYSVYNQEEHINIEDEDDYEL